MAKAWQRCLIALFALLAPSVAFATSCTFTTTGGDLPSELVWRNAGATLLSPPDGWATDTGTHTAYLYDPFGTTTTPVWRLDPGAGASYDFALDLGAITINPINVEIEAKSDAGAELQIALGTDVVTTVGMTDYFQKFHFRLEDGASELLSALNTSGSDWIDIIQIKVYNCPRNDEDGDGALLFTELINGASDTNADFDGDGVPDGWEVDVDSTSPSNASDFVAPAWTPFTVVTPKLLEACSNAVSVPVLASGEFYADVEGGESVIKWDAKTSYDVFELRPSTRITYRIRLDSSAAATAWDSDTYEIIALPEASDPTDVLFHGPAHTRQNRDLALISYNSLNDAGDAIELWGNTSAVSIDKRDLNDGYIIIEYDMNSCPVDTDGDGVSDVDEATFGTDPNLADTDGDGLSDGIELGQAGLDGDNGETTTNPLLADTDGDGVNDGVEDANGNGVRDSGETDPNASPPVGPFSDPHNTTVCSHVAPAGDLYPGLTWADFQGSRQSPPADWRNISGSHSWFNYDPTSSGSPVPVWELGAGASASYGFDLDSASFSTSVFTFEVEARSSSNRELEVQFGSASHVTSGMTNYFQKFYFTLSDATDQDIRVLNTAVSGSIDIKEFKVFYCPLGDIDGDGLGVFSELLATSSETNADSDGDGVPDGWEVDFDSTDASDPASLVVKSWAPFTVASGTEIGACMDTVTASIAGGGDFFFSEQSGESTLRWNTKTSDESFDVILSERLDWRLRIDSSAPSWTYDGDIYEFTTLPAAGDPGTVIIHGPGHTADRRYFGNVTYSVLNDASDGVELWGYTTGVSVEKQDYNGGGYLIFEYDPASCPPVDSDADGLLDMEEQALGTDPYSADTDGDGLSDGIEAGVAGVDGDNGATTTDPLSADTDRDGLSDGAEDTNANGVPDAG